MFTNLAIELGHHYVSPHVSQFPLQGSFQATQKATDPPERDDICPAPTGAKLREGSDGFFWGR